MIRYDCSRFSVFLLIAFLVVISTVGFLLWRSPDSPLFWIILVFAVILYINFYSMRVTVDENWIAVSFGIGMIVYSAELGGIRSVQLVRNNFLGPWWYNPKATEVIKMEMRDGRRLIFDADRPVNLIEMLRSRQN